MRVAQLARRALAPIGACLLLALPLLAQAQLVVTPLGGGVTPTTLTNSLLSGGSGITIVNSTFTGANGAAGTFSGGNGIVGFAGGVLLTTGAVVNVVGPNDVQNKSTSNNLAGDAQLDALVGGGTQDASVLEITFIPSGNTVQFSYVFGSEEYSEFVNSEFNDVFAFFVNGVNYALVPGTQTAVAINNINCGVDGVSTGVNCNLFIHNPVGSGVRNTQLDGLTQVLSFNAPVNAGQQNTLRLTIADRSDRIYDSAVFLAGGSFSANPAPSASKSFSPNPSALGSPTTLTVTLTNPGTSTLTGVAFTDTYPAGLTNTASPNGSTTCGGGVVTAVAGGNSLALSGGSIAGNGSCTVTVTVSANASPVVNTIPAGGVTTANSGPSTAPASATLTAPAQVVATPVPTLSQWTLLLMIGFLALAGGVRLRRLR